MKTQVLLTLTLLVSSCSNPQQQYEQITEAQVKSTIEGFFYSFNVENDDPNLIDRYVTEDFIIYEAGEKMTKEDFMAMVSEMNGITKTEWVLSDYRITIDYNTAHASLLNDGRFILENDTSRTEMKLQWLESAFLVKENDSLKIKFYFSDNIGREMNPLQE